jgi:hypothetical protein
MYRLIRNTHLVVGLLSFAFVLMYAVSAVQMAHRIAIAPEVHEEDLALGAGLAPRPLAEMLSREHGYSGELGNPQAMPGGFRVTIGRPGRIFTVRYDQKTGKTHVRRETRPFLGMLNRLHHQNGLDHDDGRLNAWGWALALVSVALLALGTSGVYLWFKMHAERAVGAALLAANLIVSLGLLAMMRG